MDCDTPPSFFGRITTNVMTVRAVVKGEKLNIHEAPISSSVPGVAPAHPTQTMCMTRFPPLKLPPRQRRTGSGGHQGVLGGPPKGISQRTRVGLAPANKGILVGTSLVMILTKRTGEVMHLV